MTDAPPTLAARLLAARRPRVPGTCAVCGAELTGYAQKTYCSEACKRRAKHQRRKARATDRRAPPATG